MATFLTTSKMSPELAARVEASVRGRGSHSGRSVSRRSVSLLRFSVVLSAITLVCGIVMLRQRAHLRLESARAELLSEVKRDASALSSRQRQLPTRVESWVQREGTQYA